MSFASIVGKETTRPSSLSSRDMLALGVFYNVDACSVHLRAKTMKHRLFLDANALGLAESKAGKGKMVPNM
jgi:hypothetical protein